MLRTIVPIFFALAIAFAGGVYSSEKLTANFEGFSELTIDGWTAYPDAGSRDADPYSRARSARLGRVALGSAEGLEFVAISDLDGDPILGSCDYRIFGKTPPSRAWTLRAIDEELFPIGDQDGNIYTLHSGNILRDKQGMFDIIVSEKIQPNNWLKSAGNGQQYFVLTLYDTSIATTTGISDFHMPTVQRIKCDDR